MQQKTSQHEEPIENPLHYTDYTGAGIYALVNVMDASIYIGKSQNIHTRFQAHRSNFKRKANVNEMYCSPIEDFVFLILYKMNDYEFNKFGAIVENIYIRYIQQRWSFKLYNRTDRYDVDGFILEMLSEQLSPGEHLNNAFSSRIGRFSHSIKASSTRTRKQLLAEIKLREEQA